MTIFNLNGFFIFLFISYFKIIIINLTYYCTFLESKSKISTVK